MFLTLLELTHITLADLKSKSIEEVFTSVIYDSVPKQQIDEAPWESHIKTLLELVPDVEILKLIDSDGILYKSGTPVAIIECKTTKSGAFGSQSQRHILTQVCAYYWNLTGKQRSTIKAFVSVSPRCLNYVHLDNTEIQMALNEFNEAISNLGYIPSPSKMKGSEDYSGIIDKISTKTIMQNAISSDHFCDENLYYYMGKAIPGLIPNEEMLQKAWFDVYNDLREANIHKTRPTVVYSSNKFKCIFSPEKIPQIQLFSNKGKLLAASNWDCFNGEEVGDFIEEYDNRRDPSRQNNSIAL